VAPVEVPPPPPVLDTTAKPVINWSVPPRYDASWSNYSSATGTYVPAYANPSTWSIVLDGCASTSTYRITKYTFTIRTVDTPWRHTVSGPSCRFTVKDVLPRQGSYRVSLTLSTSLLGNGVSLPVTETVTIRDQLIVSLGDSLASGEGNPDAPGAFTMTYDANGWPNGVATLRPVVWKDRRCHRSARSGPALAAKALEDSSPHTSVTFLSLACSGATIANLVDTPYDGIEPTGLTLPPQVEQVASLVGPSADRGGRPVDALLVSAGVNDLKFSRVIEDCASNNNRRIGHEDCVTGRGLEGILANMNRRYDSLASAIAVQLPNTRETYLNDYPASIFKGGGCGQLGLPGLGIDEKEADFMAYYGRGLNHEIRTSTTEHRLDNRWNFVGGSTTGMEGPFEPFAYCDSPSWFVRFEDSWRTQGNELGTAHPNAAGHAHYASMLRSAVVPDQRKAPYRRVTIVIDALKVGQFDHSASLKPLRVDMSMQQYQNDGDLVTRRVDVPRTGRWVPVPAATATFTLDVWPTPSSPRHPTRMSLYLTNIPALVHSAANGFGEGIYEVTYPVSGLSGVRYHVIVDNLTGGGGTIG
jgi:hypothetical protein